MVLTMRGRYQARNFKLRRRRWDEQAWRKFRETQNASRDSKLSGMPSHCEQHRIKSFLWHRKTVFFQGGNVNLESLP